MKTYKEFCLLSEAISSQRTNSRIRELQKKLNKIPRNGKHSNKISTINREIDKLQRRMQSTQTKRQMPSIRRAASNIKRLTPKSIKRGSQRAVNFAKYTGAGMALGLIGE
jgi:arginine/lysine/ornithine decarboxylase